MPFDIAVKKPMTVDLKPQDGIRDATASVVPPHRVAPHRAIGSEYSGSPFRTATAFGSFRQANYIYPQNGTGYGLSFASIQHDALIGPCPRQAGCIE